MFLTFNRDGVARVFPREALQNLTVRLEQHLLTEGESFWLDIHSGNGARVTSPPWNSTPMAMWYGSGR